MTAKIVFSAIIWHLWTIVASRLLIWDFNQASGIWPNAMPNQYCCVSCVYTSNLKRQSKNTSHFWSLIHKSINHKQLNWVCLKKGALPPHWWLHQEEHIEVSNRPKWITFNSLKTPEQNHYLLFLRYRVRNHAHKNTGQAPQPASQNPTIPWPFGAANEQILMMFSLIPARILHTSHQQKPELVPNTNKNWTSTSHRQLHSKAFLVMKILFLKNDGNSASAESAAISQQFPTRPWQASAGSTSAKSTGDGCRARARNHRGSPKRETRFLEMMLWAGNGHVTGSCSTCI